MQVFQAATSTAPNLHSAIKDFPITRIHFLFPNFHFPLYLVYKSIWCSWSPSASWPPSSFGCQNDTFFRLYFLLCQSLLYTLLYYFLLLSTLPGLSPWPFYSLLTFVVLVVLLSLMASNVIFVSISLPSSFSHLSGLSVQLLVHQVPWEV